VGIKDRIAASKHSGRLLRLSSASNFWRLAIEKPRVEGGGEEEKEEEKGLARKGLFLSCNAIQRLNGVRNCFTPKSL
jgi:hypothetical protein